MAAGDAFGYLVDVGPSSTSNYQPAAGVEICITSIALEEPSDSRINLVNGTLEAKFVQQPGNLTASGLLNTKIIITNTNYLAFNNQAAGGSRSMGITGIQLK
jgi:hypothetical protein